MPATTASTNSNAPQTEDEELSLRNQGTAFVMLEEQYKDQNSNTTVAPCHTTLNEIGGDQYNITYQTPDVREILISLKPVERGGYYVPPCMNGTRETILQEIDHWLDDADAPNVLWISGNPGAGKSTVASSLVSKLIERRRLGSSFFFKRGDVTLSDPSALWRSTAYNLAQYCPNFAENLVKSVRNRSVLHERPDIALHFKYLIKEPLVTSHKSPPFRTVPVVVIDALDECDSHPVQQKNLVDTLTQWSRLPGKFKLIVTSRDGRFLSEEFRAICKQMALPTGIGVSDEVNADIHRFFEERFASLAVSLSPECPWERVLDVLTTRAAGLFIWAETVVRFVDKGLPVERLGLVFNGDLGGGNDITRLYRQVLDLSFSQASGRTLEVFRHVVGSIVFAKAPLLTEDVSQLVSEPYSSVKFILDKLSSVISIGEKDRRLQIGHLSFSEFLCDRQRCPNEFLIDQCKESHQMAMACLRVMKHGLKFNICELISSYLLNEEIEDLPQRIETNISSALLYSCRF